MVAAGRVFAGGVEDPLASVFLATMGAALALVGPGAWSIDARLFGESERRIARRGKYPRGRAANLLGQAAPVTVADILRNVPSGRRQALLSRLPEPFRSLVARHL